MDLLGLCALVLAGFTACAEFGSYAFVHPVVRQLFASGDRVVDRWTGQGTHQGELMGIAPTGRPVTASGISIHRIADGKIAETWNNYDAAGVLRQVGAISGMSSEG